MKRIQELVKLVEDSKSIAELTIEEKGFKFHMKAANRTANNPSSTTNNAGIPITAIPASQTSQIAKREQPFYETNKHSTRKYIKSPIVGTFYIRPKPELPPFVKVGDVIKSGKVVCVIESMKLFNEIESDIAGTVVEILVKDATPIEYGQELFVIE